jgi:hypothetical protein
MLFEIVKIFSPSNTIKEFNTQKFLHSYSSILNSKRKKIIKEYFIRTTKASKSSFASSIESPATSKIIDLFFLST